MKYHSPFSIFKSLGIDAKEIEPGKLKQLEKRLLLELELSGEITLQAGDTQLSKNDILTLFSDLGEDNELFYHQVIHQNPALETFLINGGLDMTQDLYNRDILYSPWMDEFREFISPFLVDVLKKEINIYFNKREWRKAFRLLSLTDLLSDYYKSAAFDKLAGSLSHLITKIGDFSRGDVPLDTKNYQFLSHDHFISFMNALPEEFNNYREKLAINLNNLGAQYQKSHLKFVNRIFMVLRELNCSASMKKTIMDNSNILINSYNRSEDEKENEEGSTGYGCVSLIGILILFFILVRACGYLTEDKPTYNYSPPTGKDLREIIESQKRIFQQKKKHREFVGKLTELINSLPDSTSNPGYNLIVPPKPYFAYYKPFTNRISGDSVLIKNESGYDVIVFGIATEESFSIGVPAKTERYILMNKREELTFYIGKYWTTSKKVVINKRRPDLLYSLYNGFFAESSEFTLSQLDQYYAYQPSADRAEQGNNEKGSTVDSIEAVLEEIEISEEELPSTGGVEVAPPGKASSTTPDYPTVRLVLDTTTHFVAVLPSEELKQQ